MKSVLSIAGSDSSGGAGIQADIKTMCAHGVFAQTAITAITAQNTLGVLRAEPVDAALVADQITCVFEDIRPDAVKIGMISTADVAQAVARALHQQQAQKVVLDPVMVATSGAELSSSAAVETIVKELFPLAALVTPNLSEASVLAGFSISSEKDMEHAANIIQTRGAKAVLVKGGHFSEGAHDVLLTESGSLLWFRHERVATVNTHGTGCTLSSAIASNLAKGLSLEASVGQAKSYITGALLHDVHLGKGSGPLNHLWRCGKQQIDRT